LLIATDGSDVTHKAVQAAIGLARATGGELFAITFTAPAPEEELRTHLKAPSKNLDQALYVSHTLKTSRVMVKDEDVCLHCGLCAERCPTGAWDMQKFLLQTTKAGTGCRGANPAGKSLTQRLGAVA